jgi:hypothetical protein
MISEVEVDSSGVSAPDFSFSGMVVLSKIGDARKPTATASWRRARRSPDGKERGNTAFSLRGSEVKGRSHAALSQTPARW